MLPKFIGEKKLSEVLPYLELIAKFHNLRINKYKEFTKVIKLFISRLN